MQSSIQPLDDMEIEELEAFLFSEQVPEEAMDFIALHGFLTALAVAPQPTPKEQWLSLVFDGEPQFTSDAQRERIIGLIEREFQATEVELYTEEELSLPCELTLEPEEDGAESILTDWAQGFMEGVFLQEAAWFEKGEEQVAEMLLPIMLASGLFDDPDFEQMRANEKLCEQLCEEIPEVVTDLYLFYRAPEEKAGPKGGPKTAAKGPGKHSAKGKAPGKGKAKGQGKKPGAAKKGPYG